jgi:hypothetical protein
LHVLGKLLKAGQLLHAGAVALRGLWLVAVVGTRASSLHPVAQSPRDPGSDKHRDHQRESADSDLNLGGTELLFPMSAPASTNTTTPPTIRLTPKPPMKYATSRRIARGRARM